MSPLTHPDFKAFVSKRAAYNRPITVFSYFAIFARILQLTRDPDNAGDHKFLVTNEALMQKLHPNAGQDQILQSQPTRIGKLTRIAKKDSEEPEVFNLSSTDDDNDDNDVQVVQETKPDVEYINPFKRKKFSVHNHFTIDLISSDDDQKDDTNEIPSQSLPSETSESPQMTADQVSIQKFNLFISHDQVPIVKSFGVAPIKRKQPQLPAAAAAVHSGLNREPTFF
jgi:hypothetical protein